LTDTHTIERLLAPSLQGMGFRLVRVTFGGGGRPVLQVMAEPRDGSPMTVEHCAEVSRVVSAVLDVEDPIPTAYMLEVSSPGIDRPLVDRDDFRRFAGFEARIDLLRPADGRKRFRGRIKPVGPEDMVTIVDEKGPASFPFDDIAKAKLILTDELIEATQSNHIPPPGAAEAADPLSAAG